MGSDAGVLAVSYTAVREALIRRLLNRNPVWPEQNVGERVLRAELREAEEVG